MRPSWDDYFMLMAKLSASRSTCCSRPTGAVIVRDTQIVATGYNGSLPGQPHCTDSGACHRRSSNVTEEVKYDVCRSAHAEANAITLAAKQGLSVKDCTMYCTLEPCFTCAKLIAISGISRVVYELNYESPIAERDALWKSILYDTGIEVERLWVPLEVITCAKDLLDWDTSRRRIS